MLITEALRAALSIMCLRTLPHQTFPSSTTGRPPLGPPLPKKKSFSYSNPAADWGGSRLARAKAGDDFALMFFFKTLLRVLV